MTYLSIRTKRLASTMTLAMMMASTLHCEEKISEMSYKASLLPVVNIKREHSLTYQLNEKVGIEYFNEYQTPELLSLTILGTSKFTKVRYDRTYFQKPVLFRVTLKGYSLFTKKQEYSSYFSFERAEEVEIRKPEFFVSFTKHFE